MNNAIKKNRIFSYKKKKTKIYFHKIEKIITKKNFSLVDLGSASGHFINFIDQKKKNKKNTFLGIEKQKYLLDLSVNSNPNIRFIKKDFSKKSFKLDKKFDYVTCLGTINLFNNIERILLNIFKLSKKNGKILIYDIFNNKPINVRTSFNIEGDHQWHNCQNYYSKQHVIDICKKINPLANLRFYDVSFQNLKVKMDPKFILRSHTAIVNNKVKFISPFNQILNFKILEIHNL